MYGTTWCQDCKRAKQFFGEHRVPYAFVDVDQDGDGLRVVERLNDGKRIIPTIVFPDGAVLVEPRNPALLAEGIHRAARLAGQSFHGVSTWADTVRCYSELFDGLLR